MNWEGQLRCFFLSVINSQHRGRLSQMKLLHNFKAFVFTLLAVSLATPTAQAEIIDLDFSALNPATTTAATIEAFQDAEAFWESRILGYSNTIPGDIRSQLNGRLTISINQADLGGGGALANAGVTNAVTSVLGGRNRAVGTQAVMNFDPNTIANFSQSDLTDVIIHEMGHALGIGTLWQANNLVQPIPARGGILQYRGINARREFAEEAGFNRPQVGFVPIEQQGGIGTALAHWDDDNFFFNSQNIDNRVELLTGFFIPDTERFISETTFASLVDLGYVVSGFNEDELIDFTNPPRDIFPKNSPANLFAATGTPLGASPFRSSSRGANLTLQGGASAVPEPSAAMLLLAGMLGFILRRQRKFS